MDEPKPYYQDERTTIYHGDCLEVLPHLGRFDLLLTDPPYGIGYAGSMKLGQKHFGWKQYEGGWDESRPSDELIKMSVSSAITAMVWGGNFFNVLDTSPGWLVWNKVQRNFSMGEAELCWTNLLNSIRVFDMARGACLADGKQHPTQKPTALIQWCLGFAPDAETVLDPFMGSGTTLVAAKLEGRKAVGIEISEKYCEIAATRLAQGVLF